MRNVRPIKVVRDTKYQSQYRLEWKNGDLTGDFYNLTRANDILHNYADYRKNMKMLGNKRALGIAEMPLDCIP